jgi:DNA-binding XRE family transcriptional regulator
MIKNEREYRITRAQAQKLEEALSELSRTGGDTRLPLILQQAQRDSLQSQLDDLREELSEYEGLRSGKRTVISLDSLEELPRALIQARIAAGLSQRDLAERLGVKEQQIQRYEAADYAGASLERLSAVIRALGARVREDVILAGGPDSLANVFEDLKTLVHQTVAAHQGERR